MEFRTLTQMQGVVPYSSLTTTAPYFSLRNVDHCGSASIVAYIDTRLLLANLERPLNGERFISVEPLGLLSITSITDRLYLHLQNGVYLFDNPPAPAVHYQHEVWRRVQSTVPTSGKVVLVATVFARSVAPIDYKFDHVFMLESGYDMLIETFNELNVAVCNFASTAASYASKFAKNVHIVKYADIMGTGLNEVLMNINAQPYAEPWLGESGRDVGTLPEPLNYMQYRRNGLTRGVRDD